MKLQPSSFTSRLLLAVAAVCLLCISGEYRTVRLQDEQKERPAPQEKSSAFEYVCPMHSDVKSKTKGTCRKCKMSLVKKRAPKTTA